MTDTERELLLDRLYMLCMAETDPALRRWWFDRIREETAKRSPEQVAKMEVEKGLRAA